MADDGEPFGVGSIGRGDLSGDDPDPQLRWTGVRPKLADEIGWAGLADQVDLTRELMDAPPQK